jgi:putative endonuclease
MPNNFSSLISTTQTGQEQEVLACDYLISQGLQLVMQNYQCKLGEIDIIMQDKDTLVFVEVRHRKQNNYVSGIESINKSKQRKIIKTSQYYLQAHKLTNKFSCRFDVVITEQTDKQQFLWIKDAFWVQ